MNSIIAVFLNSFARNRLLKTSLLVGRPEDKQNNSFLFSMVNGFPNPMKTSLIFVTSCSQIVICDGFSSL